MNKATITNKTSILSTKWLKIIAAIFIGLYLLIWAISSPLTKHFVKPILLEQKLILSDESSIRYNPFLSELTIRDFTLYKDKINEQNKVFAIDELTVRLTLFRLLFDKIVVSKFELTDAYLKVEKTPTQLFVAGVDVNQASNDSNQAPTTDAEPQPLPYQLILPELVLKHFNIDINNNDKPHEINLKTLLISKVIADQQSQQATLSLQSTIDSTSFDLNADADFEQGQGAINSELSIANYPIKRLQRYIEDLSELSGSLSLASKQKISIAPEQFQLHITDAKLSNKDLLAGYQQQFFNLESFESTISDLALTISQGEITQLSGTSELILNNANAYYDSPNQKLAYFEQLALQGISFHFIEEPQIKVASIVMDNVFASKNETTEFPALATLKQFSISDILISEKQFAINKIIVDSLQSNIIVNKEKAIANLVALPANTENTEQATQESVPEVEPEIEVKEPTSEFLISLNEFALINETQISLLDQSVEPVKERLLYIDTLSLGALNNALDKRDQETPFKLVGRTNKYAHFDFSGFTKPFAATPSHHLQGFLKELSLPNVSRYMKQAMQMELKSGQLNTDIDVTLTGEELDGNVIVLLRGLETAIADSDEAGALIEQGALPFNMALGMLKDSNGDVELDVPLSGSTSDPSFGLSSIVSLITQKAIWMATQDYLMTTFVPYANIVSVAMTVGEFALKLRFDDLIYKAKQIEPDETQKAYLDAFIALMHDKEDTRVNICAISTPADIGLVAGTKITDKKQIQQLKDIGEQREHAFKDYIIKEGNISSSRLLLCAPKIDSDKDAKPSIALSV